MGHHLTPPADVAAWLADQRARGALPAGFLLWWHHLNDAMADLSDSVADSCSNNNPAGTMGMAVCEAAQMTDYSTRHLRRLAETGQIRAWQPGGPGSNWRIDIASVREYQAGGSKDHPMMDLLGVLACAERGDYTMPDDLMDAYARYETAKGAQAAKLAAELRLAVNGRREQLIAEHIAPSLDNLMVEIADVVTTLGVYAHTDSPPPDLLTAPENVRHAYLAFDPLVNAYRNIRAGWRALRVPGDCVDPLGLDSPAAEIRDVNAHIPQWQASHVGRAYWPWGHGDRLKLAWAITNSITLWTPTAQQQSDAWRGEWEKVHGDAYKRSPAPIHNN